jgi:hypothetical protein
MDIYQPVRPVEDTHTSQLVKGISTKQQKASMKSSPGAKQETVYKTKFFSRGMDPELTTRTRSPGFNAKAV